MQGEFLHHHLKAAELLRQWSEDKVATSYEAESREEAEKAAYLLRMINHLCFIRDGSAPIPEGLAAEDVPSYSYQVAEIEIQSL